MQPFDPRRRRHLKQLSLAAGALTFGFPNVVFGRKKEKLGVALVGLGYYSTQLLAPALQETEHCYLAGIVTGTPSKAETWKAKYDLPEANIYNYETFDQIANNDAIDVIYIVLPNNMHAEYSIRAAQAGKHVWCEKPMALNVAECEAMIKAAKDNGVTLAIGYRMQHEPNTRKLMSFAGHEDFGAARLVQAAAGYRQNNEDHWKLRKKMGGGAMYDMGVYPLQGARYSIGEEPVAVMAQHQILRPALFTEVDEVTSFQLEFPGGAMAQCTTSFGYGGVNSLEVIYEKGKARLEPFSSYRNVQGTASGDRTLEPWPGNQQARQMDDDALAIMNDTPLLVPGEEGLRDIRVVEAVYASAKKGERIRI